MKIDLKKLNGDRGNTNYYRYSNISEEAVTNGINQVLGKNIFTHIFTKSVSHGDFYYKKELGDIKMRSGTDLFIETEQIKRGKLINGWFLDYYSMDNPKMKWIMFINQGSSNMYGKVWKVRLIDFDIIKKYFIDNINIDQDVIKLKNGAKGYFINPKDLSDDGWIGHFTKTNDGCIDTEEFYPKPNIDL